MESKREKPLLKYFEKYKNGEDNWQFENDEDYYYAIGMMLRYIVDINKRLTNDVSMQRAASVRDFSNRKMTHERIRNLLLDRFNKYGSYYFAIDPELTQCQVFRAIMSYKPKKPRNEYNHFNIMAGFSSPFEFGEY